jgi:ribose-phosphate pyrophosphokinase
VVIPYYGMQGRKERLCQGSDLFEACANLITTAGASRVLSMDLHAADTGFFDIPVDTYMHCLSA